MATNLVLPLKISFQLWCSQLRSNLPEYNVPIAPKDDTNWWKWAEILLMTNGNLGGVTLPSRQTFPKVEDWRKWAIFFINDVKV